MSKVQGGLNRPTAGALSAYAAASSTSNELMGWNPSHAPIDTQYLGSREKIGARIHDLVRNDGWASGGVTSYLDSVIGADLRLSAKPDWKALKIYDKAFDDKWAKEFASAVEAQWRTWAYDVGKYSDASRHNTIGELFCLAFRHKLLDGDAVAIAHYDPKRGGKFSSFIEMMHPDRMSNPDGQPDTAYLRGGVAKDKFGAAKGYHFRGAHPGEAFWGNVEHFVWNYVPRQKKWGRQNVIHCFEKTEAHQTRGVSRFTPIVERLKMLTQCDKLEIQAMVLNASMAAYIQSPFDHELFENILTPDNSNAGLSAYQEERAAFHETARTRFNEVSISTLFPGEEIGFLDPKRPNQAFIDFERQALRNIASGLGISYEQLSRDWSQTNYSSGRMALIEVWRSYSADRDRFANGFATPIYALFLEELFDKDLVPLPAGGADFWTDPTAFTKAKWIGPARGWVDPTKEAQAAQIRMETGVSTLEDECAEQGKDYEEVLAQLAREQEMKNELGIKPSVPNQVPDSGGDEDD